MPRIDVSAHDATVRSALLGVKMGVRTVSTVPPVTVVTGAATLRGRGLMRAAGVAPAPLAKVQLQFGHINQTSPGGPMESTSDGVVQSPAYIAGVFDLATLQLHDHGIVGQIHAQNPNTKCILYWLPQRAVNWYENWGTLNNNESWFLHNPAGTMTAAARVRRTLGTEISYVMDMTQAGLRDYYTSFLMAKVNTYGYDGFVNDGPLYTVHLGGVGGWVVAPTAAQIAAYPNNQLAWLQQIKAALGSKELWTNTTMEWLDHPGYKDDAVFLDHVDGTMAEGFYHQDWEPYTSTNIANYWPQHQAKYQRNLDAGKRFQGGSGSTGTVTQRRRWLDFALGSILLKADGVRGSLQWKSRTGPASSEHTYINTDFGQPQAAEFVNADGNTQRNFTKATVIVNGSGSARGGIGAYSASIVTF